MKEKKIFYIKNRGEGDAVLFIHGIPGSYKDFEEFSMNLNQKGYETLIFDRPGYNKSYAVDVDYDNYFEIYYNFIKRHFKSKINIVAYSFGCYIALKLASIYPEIVKSLILISPYFIHNKEDKINNFYFKVKKSILKLIINIIFKTKIKIGLLDHIKKVFSPDKVPIDIIEKIKKNTSIETVIGGFIDKNIMIENPLFKDETVKINIPIHIIQGNKDKIFYKDNYKELFKNFTLITIENRGHALIFTEKVLVKEKIEFYLKGQ